MTLLQRIGSKLAARASRGGLRKINPPSSSAGNVDFASNDYIGLARDHQFSYRIEEAIALYKERAKLHNLPIQGSSGSRLLTGNTKYLLETEQKIASFHKQRHALLANSGWDLNFGLISTLSTSNTVIIYDELCHNSMLMGIKFAKKARSLPFRHNDLNHLQELLSQHSHKEILILAESIYSMDGDCSPLPGILSIAQSHTNSFVIVDEAHSIGVIGASGEGMVASNDLSYHPNLLGVVYTYGKALGCHGAAFATSHENLVSYLVNYCSPIIYSTSLPIHSVVSIEQGYEYLPLVNDRRLKLQELIAYFQQHSSHLTNNNNSSNHLSLSTIPSSSAIQGIIFPGNENVLALSQCLKTKAKIDCLAIRSPTVKEGSERLRVVLHSYNTTQDIDILCDAIDNYIKRQHSATTQEYYDFRIQSATR